jgi:hypothetical protein
MSTMMRKVAASNTGGGLEGILLSNPIPDKGHLETSSSTAFQLIFYTYIKIL